MIIINNAYAFTHNSYTHLYKIYIYIYMAYITERISVDHISKSIMLSHTYTTSYQTRRESLQDYPTRRIIVRDQDRFWKLHT